MAETSAEPVGRAAKLGLTLREFVFPTGEIFWVREADWIEAVELDQDDVLICDEHGRYLEFDGTQTGEQITFRVVFGHEYHQFLVPAVELAVGPPKQRGRGR